MKVVKMKTVHTHKHGQTNILPYVGLVKISNEGIIEVSVDHAEKIEKANIGFSIVQPIAGGIVVDPNEEEIEKIKEKSDNDELNRKGDDELNNEDDKEEIRKALRSKTMTFAKLQGMAKPFPRKEWGVKSKVDLIDYLEEKLTA